jgi:RNA-directed DNA polymerase
MPNSSNRSRAEISDGHMLHLIKMWLEAPVGRDDGKGRKGRRGPRGFARRSKYMRRFVLGWTKRGLETRFDAKIVVYADDYVTCCRGDAEQAMVEMRRLMTQLKLTVNDAKTHIRCRRTGLPFSATTSVGTTLQRRGARTSARSRRRRVSSV